MVRFVEKPHRHASAFNILKDERLWENEGSEVVEAKNDMTTLHHQSTGSIIHPLENPLGVSRLEDVELWGSEKPKGKKADQGIEYRSQRYVNPRKIPVWSLGGGVTRVYSRNEQTQEFFTALYNCCGDDEGYRIGDVGLLVSRGQSEEDWIVFYFEAHEEEGTELLAVSIDLSVLEYIDQEVKVEEDGQATFINNAVKPMMTHAQLTLLNTEQFRRRRSVTPFDVAAKMKMRLNKRDQDLYLRMKEQKYQEAQPLVKTEGSTSSRGSTAEPISQQESKNRTTIQRVILSELRLRQIKKDNEEYKHLYHHTYRAATYALRNDLSKQPIELSHVHDTVDKLLNLFLG